MSPALGMKLGATTIENRKEAPLKLKVELHGPSITHLDRYPEKNHNLKNMHPSVFTEALLMTAKMWRLLLDVPWTDEWVERCSVEYDGTFVAVA